MPVPSLSKAEWFAVAAIAAMLIALVPPTPHWRETESQSCHLCGNCRVIVRTFRWWRLDSETIEPATTFPVPDGHDHDWWTYGSSYISYNAMWAASNVGCQQWIAVSRWSFDLGPVAPHDTVWQQSEHAQPFPRRQLRGRKYFPMTDEEPMIAVIFRECVVLLVGVAVSFVASLFGNAGRDFGALVAAFLFPIAFCLTRAALVRYPPAHMSWIRRGGFQLVIGLALVSLLAFEMGVALFAGSADIPLGAWVVVAGFGIGYVLLFCVAHRVGHPRDRVAV